MVFCRECNKRVEDCPHCVDPVDVPAVAVFDPKIKTLAYKEETRVLEIAFKNGQVWQLIGIPPSVYQEMLQATLSSFLKILARRYRAAPVRSRAGNRMEEEQCPACKRPMIVRHQTSGGTRRILWHCEPCHQSFWRTYAKESVRERRYRGV